jgi:hypothetical protein
MSSFDEIKDTFKRIFNFDDSTPLPDILAEYRRLEKEYQANQKSMDICSPYGTIFSMSVLTLLAKLRNRINSDESILEVKGFQPQIKETLDEIRLNKKRPGSLLWFEETSPVWRSYNPLNWQVRIDAEYDPEGDDYFEARQLLKYEICDPVTWKYRREAIPIAVFKNSLPELQASFVFDLRNIFGFGYYHHVVILARSALEASLKDKLNLDGYIGLGDNPKNRGPGLITLYSQRFKPEKRVIGYMRTVQKEGNNAVHSLAHMKKIREQEKTAYETIVKLIFCLEEIYK